MILPESGAPQQLRCGGEGFDIPGCEQHLGLTVEARKLEYDCPPTRKLGAEGTPA